jgi:hypothetical protein
VLAGLVVINVLWETKRGRERTLGQTRRTLHGSGARMLRTAGVFCAICLLWSLWTADSLVAWLALWPAALRGTTDIAGWLPTLAVAVVAVRTSQDPPRSARSASVSWWTAYRAVWVSVGTLLLLTALGIQAVYARLGPTAATFINSLRSGQLSRVDAAMLERGYYEDLMRVDRFNGQLWEIYMKKPARWFGVEGLGLERFTGDFRQKELVPSFRVLTEHGTISTNQWGMRDREYTKEPAAPTFRVAMLGASSVMGWGVGDGETFESLVEAELSRDTDTGPDWEILNLGVPGYSAPQQLATLPKALSFSPDALFYVSPGRELSVATRYLAEVVRKGIPIPYDHLADVVRRSGVEPTQEESVALRRLEPLRGEILSWIYETIVAQCRAQGVLPVYIFLPQVYEGQWQDETPEMLQRAEAAGFVVIDLQDVFAGRDVETVRLAEWDNHPNVLGHRLIAERLASEIRLRAEIFSRQSDPHASTTHPEGDP